MNIEGNGGDARADSSISAPPGGFIASSIVTTNHKNNDNNGGSNNPTITTGGHSNNDKVEGGEKSVVENHSGKRPKRKVAIIFGYIGERYYGLQWNHMPDYPTIEEELLRALHCTNMISQENYEQEKVQQKLNWERASRTDKGVHALRNVISVNVMLPNKKDSTTEYDTEEARRQLMAVLPHDIVVYEVVPVTRSFNAYMMCGARTYEYYLPTFAFMGQEEYSKVYFPPELAPSQPTLEEVGFITSSSGRGAENTKISSCAVPVHPEKRPREEDNELEGRLGEKGVNSHGSSLGLKDGSVCEGLRQRGQEDERPGIGKNETVYKFHDSLFEKLMVFRTIPEDAMQRLASYRLSSARLEHVRSIFHLYEGTHSYHNFTPGGRASDPSSVRYITSVTVGEPFLVDPGSAAVLSTLDGWTPSRCYSPEGERNTLLPRTHEGDVEQQRLQMREHMLQVYGNGVGGQEGEEGECRFDSSGDGGGGSSGGLEVVRIELHGQSFMLNQIRKMIGAVISICAAGFPAEYLREHMLNKTVRCGTPMAPANGLFLSYLDFQRYNCRLNRIQCEGSNGMGKNGVYVDRVSEDAVAEFRGKIVAVVLRNEMVGDLMGRWMRSLRHVLRLACDINLP